MRVRRSRAAGRAMAAMVEEDSWDNGRGKEAHEVEKVQRAKGRWDGVGVPGVRARGALPGGLARHMVRCQALRRFDGWPARSQARAVAGRIERSSGPGPRPRTLVRRSGTVCAGGTRARPNKAGSMTPDEERRAREVRGRSIRNKPTGSRLEPRLFVF